MFSGKYYMHFEDNIVTKIRVNSALYNTDVDTLGQIKIVLALTPSKMSWNTKHPSTH